MKKKNTILLLCACLISTVNAANNDIHFNNMSENIIKTTNTNTQQTGYARETKNNAALADKGWWEIVEPAERTMDKQLGNHKKLAGVMTRWVLREYIRTQVQDTPSNSWMRTTNKVRDSLRAFQYLTSMIYSETKQKALKPFVIGGKADAKGEFEKAWQSQTLAQKNGIVYLNWVKSKIESDNDGVTKSVDDIGDMIKQSLNSSGLAYQVDCAVRDVKIYVDELNLDDLLMECKQTLNNIKTYRDEFDGLLRNAQGKVKDDIDSGEKDTFLGTEKSKIAPWTVLKTVESGVITMSCDMLQLRPRGLTLHVATTDTGEDRESSDITSDDIVTSNQTSKTVGSVIKTVQPQNRTDKQTEGEIRTPGGNGSKRSESSTNRSDSYSEEDNSVSENPKQNVSKSNNGGSYSSSTSNGRTNGYSTSSEDTNGTTKLYNAKEESSAIGDKRSTESVTSGANPSTDHTDNDVITQSSYDENSIQLSNIVSGELEKKESEHDEGQISSSSNSYGYSDDVTVSCNKNSISATEKEDRNQPNNVGSNVRVVNHGSIDNNISDNGSQRSDEDTDTKSEHKKSSEGDASDGGKNGNLSSEGNLENTESMSDTDINTGHLGNSLASNNMKSEVGENESVDLDSNDKSKEEIRIETHVTDKEENKVDSQNDDEVQNQHSLQDSRNTTMFGFNSKKHDEKELETENNKNTQDNDELSANGQYKQDIEGKETELDDTKAEGENTATAAVDANDTTEGPKPVTYSPIIKDLSKLRVTTDTATEPTDNFMIPLIRCLKGVKLFWKAIVSVETSDSTETIRKVQSLQTAKNTKGPMWTTARNKLLTSTLSGTKAPTVGQAYNAIAKMIQASSASNDSEIRPMSDIGLDKTITVESTGTGQNTPVANALMKTQIEATSLPSVLVLDLDWTNSVQEQPDPKLILQTVNGTNTTTYKLKAWVKNNLSEQSTSGRYSDAKKVTVTETSGTKADNNNKIAPKKKGKSNSTKQKTAHPTQGIYTLFYERVD